MSQMTPLATHYPTQQGAQSLPGSSFGGQRGATMDGWIATDDLKKSS